MNPLLLLWFPPIEIDNESIRKWWNYAEECEEILSKGMRIESQIGKEVYMQDANIIHHQVSSHNPWVGGYSTFPSCFFSIVDPCQFHVSLLFPLSCGPTSVVPMKKKPKVPMKEKWWIRTLLLLSWLKKEGRKWWRWEKEPKSVPPFPFTPSL